MPQKCLSLCLVRVGLGWIFGSRCLGWANSYIYTCTNKLQGFFFCGSVELTRTVGTGDWSPPCGSLGSTPRLGTTCPPQRRTVCRSSCLLSSLKHRQNGQHRFLRLGSQAPDVMNFSRTKNKYPLSNNIIILLDIWFYFYKKNSQRNLPVVRLLFSFFFWL